MEALLGAFAAALEDRVREALGDADAARAELAAAPRDVARTQLASGAYSYAFRVKLPPRALGARRLQPAGVRSLQAASPFDSLSALLADGTLVARMREAGVGNVQDLIDSGAMSVAAAALAPTGTGTASPSPSLPPAGAVSAGGGGGGGGDGGLSSGAIAGIAGAGVVVVFILLCFYFAPRVKAAIAALRGPSTPKAAPAAGLRLHTVDAFE